MENRKHLKFLILIFILGFFIVNISNVFAYEIETHAYLTEEIFDFYNKNFSNQKISDELKNYLIDGSRREDDPIRWMNHFFDPVYNRGLTVDSKIFSAKDIASVSIVNIATLGSNWLSLKEWAQNSDNQNKFKYSPVIATILSSLQSDKIQKYFSTSDFTWDTAINYWVNDNKEMAMFTLGHILHLVEDASVPDHTRNDPHPGDSPYELYTQQFTLDNGDKNLDKRLSDKQPIILNDLSSYFDGLAKYSNNGFYSKDTIGIEKGYKLPQLDYIQKDGDYYYAVKSDNNDNYYLFVYKNYKNSLILESKNNLVLKIADEDKVVNSYWSHLSTKSIQYGAGVVNLFFQEAEKEKKIVKKDNKSFIGQTISSIGGFFSNIFTSNQNFSQFINNINQNNVALGINNQTAAEENKNVVNTNIIKVQKPIQQLVNQNHQIALIGNNQIQQITSTTIQQITTTTQQIATTTQPIIQPQQAVFQQCGFNTNQSPNHQKVSINEIAWMGTTESSNNEWIELKNIFGSDVNLNGWQLIDQGEQIKITFGSADKISANNFYLLERTDDNSVSSVKADKIYTGALSNTNEGLRLFDNQCNLIDEVLANSSWLAGDSVEKRTMERDLSGFNWHTSNIINGTPKKENSSAYVVYSGGGGGSVSSSNLSSNIQTTSALASSPTKILINEIQLVSSGNVYDEFIELYNPNNMSVNLTDWYIQKKTQNGSSYSTFAKMDLFSGKIIPANGYLLVANASSSFSADIFVSSYSIADNNTLILKNSSGDIIDKVGWGTANDCDGNCALNPTDGQSIQRINFVDTDINVNDFEIQTCPSPKAQSNNCQQSQAPTQTVGVDHLVISEIYSDKTGNNFDFVELYNPTNSSIAIGDYSLKKQIGSSTSTNSLASFSSNQTIAAKSFFIIGLSNYGSSAYAIADKLNRSYSLPTSESAIIFLENGTTTIDQANYNPSNLTSGQSLERKVYQSGICVSSQNIGEFLGNDCDTNSDTDFEIRSAPNPQNSQSFPEPRNAPIVPQNFSIQFSTSTMALNFNWQESQDYIGATSTVIYKITDISNSSSTLLEISATSTSAGVAINEIGRDYNFSIQAFDKEGLNSAISTALISIPSFLTSLYFYQDPRTTDIKYLVDMNWQNYPFVPKKIESDSSWRSIIFYLNKDADKISNFGDWDWGTSASSSVKLSEYSNCGYSTVGPALILPDDQSRCSNNYGGIRNATFAWSQLEDPHLMIGLNSLQQPFSANDYLTIAFYAYDGNNGQTLVAVDKTKYYFKNESPAHQAPGAPQNFSFINYDLSLKDLMFSLNPAIDVDSVDQDLSYLASFSTSTNFSIWENLGWYNNRFQTKVQVNVGDKIAIKTTDDFNNHSLIKIITLMENNGQYGISVEDAQQPIGNFKEIILAEQINDGLLPTKYFDYGGFTQTFSPQTSGYISRVEVKAAKAGSYDIYFQVEVQENNQILEKSDASLKFRKNPFLEAGKTYKLVFLARQEAVALYGDGVDIYYKIYGLTQ